MRWLLTLILAFLLLTTAFAQEEHELKVYGSISYLAVDLNSLYLGDLFVSLEGAKIEGVLEVGALVEVEGDWHGTIFHAHEVEVERGVSSQTVIYRGRVIAGKLLGLHLPDLTEGAHLEVVAEVEREGDLRILVMRDLSEALSGVEGSVTALFEDGFEVAGVRVVSTQTVRVGERVSVQGEWDGSVLRVPR